MITDTERRAAALAIDTLRANLARISPRADGNYNAGDLSWVVDETLNELVNKPENLNEIVTDSAVHLGKNEDE